MRAFVAVELSQAIRDALAGMIDRLKACDETLKKSHSVARDINRPQETEWP